MKSFYLVLLLLITFHTSFSQISQWRGINRDGQFLDTMLLKSWPEDGPTLLFSANGIGKGYSSPILANGNIYVSGMIDTLDYVTCFDNGGNKKWQVACGRSWKKSFPDTRSTPVIEEDRIYFQTGTGIVICLNSQTGEVNWQVEADKEYNTEYHNWGNSETPLLIDDLVIISPAGDSTSVVALNKFTGKEIWRSKSLGGPRAYASATIYEFNNHRYIIAVIGTHLIALKPESGDIAWSYQYHDPAKWNQSGLIWANTALCKENQIFISKGYDYKAVMLEIDSLGTEVTERFIDQTFDNHHHGMVLYDGFVYGSNWYNNRNGKWVCMNWKNGEIRYVHDWETKGSIVIADSLLYCYNEKGTVGLVKPNPDKFEVISQFKIDKGSGPHWAHPYIANGKLLIRHGDALMVYNIRNEQ